MISPSAKRLAAQGSAPHIPRPVHAPGAAAHGDAAALDGALGANLSGSAASNVPLVGQGSPEDWQRAIQKVVKAVVSIHFSNVIPFDTERTYVSEATGFVVDAERGIIMTNRHVVGPGPFRGYAVFDNHEECPVLALYRDPVHDFGFLRFDPKHIKHMRVESLDIRPEHAKVGREIRVVGNDAGEKLSILAGFISRVDRNAPEYGDMTYNDFNTEYIQAAASASGGSSGSPVVDSQGNVVALQAGGSSVASTDFFLPLFRGARALKCIQQKQPITRGTIQVRWMLRPYDECIRLGLTHDAENKARKDHPDSIGLLVAETILPEGPASGFVEEGDCLLEIDHKPIALFRDVDSVLDESVGRTITLTLMRSGELLHHDVTVQDLFSITPSRFVRVAGGVYHDVSYQIACYYVLPAKGVYVAHTGVYMVPPGTEETSGWIIDELDDKPTPDLDTFIEVVKSIPSCSNVPAKYRHVTDPRTVVTAIVNVNRKWAGGPQEFDLAVCNNETGLWDFTQLGPGAPAKQPSRQSARFVPLSHPAPPAVASLINCMVKVQMMRPTVLEGYTNTQSHQYGFVIDAEQGLVLVSRACVPHYLTDLAIVVADSVFLPARVVFLHPQQGYAVIQYDPQLIDAKITSVPLAPPPKSENELLSPGTQLTFVGYDRKSSALVQDTRVLDIATVQIPIGFDVPPRFRATNIDSIDVDSSVVRDADSGLLADPQSGVVRAIWFCFLADLRPNSRSERVFRFAIDAATVSDTVKHLRENPTLADPRFIDLEAKAIKFSQARILKVPSHWISRIEEEEGSRLRPQLLSVSRVSSRLQKYILEGDIIVAINDRLATNVVQLYNISDESVDLTVLRRGRELKITVPTTPSSATVTKSLVSWCGMNVHAPHHAVLQQVKQPPSGVYVVSNHAASPANMYGIYPTNFVTHVNGKPTPDVDTFYRVVKAIPDDVYVKLRVLTFEGVPAAISLRTNYHYFPTWRIDLDPQTGDWIVAN